MVAPGALFYILKRIEIMEDRYELRGKIGQGGLGAVYRAFDTRMNREVAIKRILVSNDDPTLEAESTRQLIKEAGALASLQHPHIVTVYDAGSDEDGPYVVMELITGKTLDELVSRAPLTWPDFRELAIQTQEALIAAHELGLVHSDIKPANLMLTWLASGKFQMKVVDFGLAMLSQSQSIEELENIESVFGSIFFMAPEQFERIPIDTKTDMYSMGCVYYQALTGHYPFTGETTHDVMSAHLHHRVVPLQDVRADIPIWACEWIMWLINRAPQDRPESARDALRVFFQNDADSTPALSLGTPALVSQPLPRSRLAIPGGSNPPGAPNKSIVAKPTNVAASAVIAPTRPNKPTSPHSRQANRVILPEPATMLIVPESLASPEPPKAITTPQPLQPPEGSKPSIYSSPKSIPSATPTKPIPSQAALPTRPYSAPPVASSPRKGIKSVIAMVCVVVILGLGFFLYQRIKQNRASRRYELILAEAATSGMSPIPMSGPELTQILEMASNTDEAKQKNIFKLLTRAKANDQANFDLMLAEFASNSTQLLPEVREALIREALEPRSNRAMVSTLLTFARTTPDTASAVAALNAIRTTAEDDQFEPFLLMLQFSPKNEIRTAVEECLTGLLKRSSKRASFSKLIDQALERNKNSSAMIPLTRLKAAVVAH